MIGAMVDMTKIKAAEEELRRSREELRSLAAYLQSVREEERSRLARELHDEIGQALTGIRLSLEIYMREHRDAAEHGLGPAVALTNELIGRVRDLSLELRPAMLDDFGVLAALKWQFQRYTTHVGVRVNFQQTAVDARRFDPEIETAAYRIVQEALTNVARHARVEAVDVDVWTDDAKLFIRVADRGVGFDVERLSTSFRRGLSGMRERAVLLGGKVRIDSAPGVGTRLYAELPINARSGSGRTRADGSGATAPGKES